MKDLPRINFKDKKRKGFLPWIQTRLGFGGRSAMGTAGQGVPILGRTALGAAKFSASSGLGAVLAGKTGFALAAAVITAAVGTAVYIKPAPPPIVPAAEPSAVSGSEYVPAVLRQQSQGSALDMFSSTNKGLMSMEEAAQQEQPAEQPGGESSSPAPVADVPAESPAPAMTNMAEQMVAKLVKTPPGGGLAGVMGSGSGKFSITGGGLGGGFGNNLGKGPAFGGKSVGMGEIGSTFPVNRTFKQPKPALTKKAMAMKGGLRPVYSKPGGGKNATGKGAFSQAKGVKTAQRSYIGTNADAARSTQDKAWEGSTAEGSERAIAGGGAGLGTEGGGSGLVTSPSLDNVGNVGGSGNVDDPVTSVSTPIDVSPWQGLPQLAMMLIMLSSALSVLGAQLIAMSNQLQAAPDPTGSNQAAAAALKAIGMAVCGVAIGMAGTATALGGVLSTVNGQAAMGGIYATGGGVATAAGVVAMTSDGSQAAAVSPSWMAGIAGVISLLGSMASTLVGSISTLAK